jgi:integrase
VVEVLAQQGAEAGQQLVDVERFGQLAGLQWLRAYLDDNPRIEIDPEFGALHEIRGRLVLGPPKTPASGRPSTPGMHFHDLRHTHKTWLSEDDVPRVLQFHRMGHKPKDTSDIYSHVTRRLSATRLDE